jgi:glucose-6-phosphate 1-dehydrogenase
MTRSDTLDRSDALVFFGATGDLAYKQVFPALAAQVARQRLDVPLIGVAKSRWDWDRSSSGHETASPTTAVSMRTRRTTCNGCCVTWTATTTTR